MSEYQYYELQAIDRPLSEGAQRDLRAISSRAHISARRFTNTYHFGDLKADPKELLARWFDALVHVTNWGTRWLAFRLPLASIAPADLAAYEGELFFTRRAEDHLCLHFLLEDEEPRDFCEGDGWLDSLLPLRSALAAGDLRSLYLAWLVDVQRGAIEDDALEPPVPPGLRTLDEAHRCFVDYMHLDAHLLAVAAEASGAPVQQPRTAGLFLARTRTLSQGRSRELERARAHLRHRMEEERRAAREEQLDALSGQEPELWAQVEERAATGKPTAYDAACALLVDLRDLADRAGTRPAWDARLAALRAAHRGKRSLLRRLDVVAGVQQGRG